MVIILPRFVDLQHPGCHVMWTKFVWKFPKCHIWHMKDLVVVWKDLKELGMQPHLWLQPSGNGFIKPTIAYVLSNEEKSSFVQLILSLKTPTRYASSLKKKSKNMGISREWNHMIVKAT